MITQWAAKRLLREFEEFDKRHDESPMPKAERFKWFCEMEAMGYWEVRRLLEAGKLG